MTTQECIEATYKATEISSLLAEIVDELNLSPPCLVTNTYFKVRLISLIRHNRIKAEKLKTYQDALNEVLKS